MFISPNHQKKKTRRNIVRQLLEHWKVIRRTFRFKVESMLHNGKKKIWKTNSNKYQKIQQKQWEHFWTKKKLQLHKGFTWENFSNVS